MTDERQYYHFISQHRKEMKNDCKREGLELAGECDCNRGYHLRDDSFNGGMRLFNGCALAAGATIVILYSIWQVCRLIFG